MSDFTPADLPRVSERIPYLYLEQCVIKRANNALVAADENGETALPIATIAVLMLGPGTTITHDAVVLASDTGAIIVWAGEQGVRHYCSGSALTGSTRLLEQQARLVSNERSRLMVARRMYAMRFPGEDLSHTTMRQLLGMEGTRVAALYTAEAKRNDIQWHGRKWDDRGGAVNIALSTANSCLYGVVHAAITALGCSPALGFVHCHNRRSFLFDIADLYKAEYSIPLAFRLHACTPSLVDGIARRRMRDMMQDGRLLERCVHDVSTLLSEEPDNEDNCSVWTGGQRYGKAGQSWHRRDTTRKRSTRTARTPIPMMVEISSGVYVGDSTPGYVRDSGNESSRNSVRAERRWHGIPSISYMSAAKTERRR